MKFESAFAATGSVDVVVFFARVNAILKRVAPGAFAFVVPVEGSRRFESVVLSTVDSVVVNPILYVGVFVYLSKTRVCGRQSAKNPLTKYTPRLILAIAALPVWFVDATVPVVPVPSRVMVEPAANVEPEINFM